MSSPETHRPCGACGHAYEKWAASCPKCRESREYVAPAAKSVSVVEPPRRMTAPCAACGNEVSTAAAACPKCGHPVPQTRVLANVAKYATTRAGVACLTCGHKGAMGITRTRVAWYATWPALLAFFVVGASAHVLIGWGGSWGMAFLGAASIMLRQRSTNVYCFCPGCEQEIGPIR